MCGIAGIVTYYQNAERLEKELKSMTRAIAHRGNNGQGFFTSKQSYCFLAHRRLAIIDLSTAALQPMKSSDGRYTIVFNGEIYNYRELAQELYKEIGFQCTTSSDTEVLLAGYQLWGHQVVTKLRGMFAFAIWDETKQELFAARDHTGMKPFYWFYNSVEGKPVLAFASELKGLLAASFIPRTINTQAVTNFLTFGAINAPMTILQQVHSLLPGHYMYVRSSGPEIHRYWTPVTISRNDGGNAAHIQQKTAELLQESVALHMRADISVGAFLSGGIDSSVLVGLMARLSSKPIETFSIGFQEHSVINELPLARLVAQKFGTSHHEIMISKSEFHTALNDFTAAIDQPSTDGMNSFFVARATAQQVSVAVSGLGGDEVFLGYRYMKDLVRLWQSQKKLFASRYIPALAQWQTTNSFVRSIIYRTGNQWMLHANKQLPVQQYASVRQLFSPTQVQDLIPALSQAVPWIDPQLAELFTDSSDWANDLSKAELLWYTAGTLLRDADATAMASTLEVRFPYLDPVLIEHLLSVPSSYKLTRGQEVNKPLLTNLFPDLLPDEIKQFPKHGFELPIRTWIQETCRAEIIRLQDIPWLNKTIIGELTYQFFKDPKNYHKMWSILVLVRWLELYCKNELYEKDFIHSSRQGLRWSRSESVTYGSGAR
jgi:asparagine synthase (glutamine-hydrolysing)